MSYSKSFTCRRGQGYVVTPYEDWLENKTTAIFRYDDHTLRSWNMHLPKDKFTATYFCPNTSVLRINAVDTFFGYSAFVSVKLTIDKDNKTVEIAELSSERYDRLYPEHATLGGFDVYTEIVSKHDGHFVDISLEDAVVRFFGYNWKLKSKDSKDIPPISEENAKNASTLEHWFSPRTFTKKDHTLATMQTICLFPDERSCTLIQSYFRGWLIRRKYRFDPSTTLGRYLALQLFKDLTVSL